MIRKLEKSHDNVIGYSLAGDVSDDEYRHTASEMRDQIAVHGKVRLNRNGVSKRLRAERSSDVTLGAPQVQLPLTPPPRRRTALAG